MSREIMEEKVSQINKLMTEVRAMKAADEKLAVLVHSNSGSILNGYREGDITFDHAKTLIDTLSCQEKVRAVIDIESVTKLISEAFASRSRSEMWDFLYGTEYESESMELNEAMACMTDDQVEKWFPKIFTEHLLKELHLL